MAALRHRQAARHVAEGNNGEIRIVPLLPLLRTGGLFRMAEAVPGFQPHAGGRRERSCRATWVSFLQWIEDFRAEAMIALRVLLGKGGE